MTAYSAEISSVFDHSIDLDAGGGPIFYSSDGKIVAYTGEEGQKHCGRPKCSFHISGGAAGYKSSDGTAFSIGGQYTGGSGCKKEPCDQWLFYNGHPGFDYPAPIGTPIFAPAPGIAFIPESDPITSRKDPEGAIDRFNILAVDHGNGFSTWYLHLGDEKTCEDLRRIQCPGEPARLITAGDRIPVARGCALGKVGNKGKVADHLHFEVRRGVENFECALPRCVPVDPYGWADGNRPDPYPAANLRLWE